MKCVRRKLKTRLGGFITMVTYVLYFCLAYAALLDFADSRVVSAQDDHVKPAQGKSNGTSRSVLDGVYTAAQSKKGQADYQEECSRCHGDNLGGAEGAPALAGDAFLNGWKGSTVGDLFDRIRTTMPSDSPGRLSRQQYADIVAYILSANNFPAGKAELERESAPLKEIRIEITR